MRWLMTTCESKKNRNFSGGDLRVASRLRFPRGQSYFSWNYKQFSRFFFCEKSQKHIEFIIIMW